jgi:hypothetical protein
VSHSTHYCPLKRVAFHKRQLRLSVVVIQTTFQSLFYSSYVQYCRYSKESPRGRHRSTRLGMHALSQYVDYPLNHQRGERTAVGNCFAQLSTTSRLLASGCILAPTRAGVRLAFWLRPMISRHQPAAALNFQRMGPQATRPSHFAATSAPKSV